MNLKDKKKLIYDYVWTNQVENRKNHKNYNKIILMWSHKLDWIDGINVFSVNKIDEIIMLINEI